MVELSVQEKRNRLNNLSEDTLMRWAYVPFVVAEGAWDYADSIINVAIQMRLTETKKLCRTIRELKRSYDRRRQGQAIGARGCEMFNFGALEDICANSLRFMYRSIKESAKRQYPELEDDYITMLSGVYACLILIEVIKKYMTIQDEKICKLCDWVQVGSIIPPEVPALQTVVREFVGDKPLKIRGRGLIVHNIVRSLLKIKFTKEKVEK